LKDRDRMGLKYWAAGSSPLYINYIDRDE